MFQVAILQNDREAIRSGYVEIASILSAAPELESYSFSVFETGSLSDLFGEASNGLMAFDALFVGTNATSEQSILNALRKEKIKLAEFLSSGRGLYLGSQKKLSSPDHLGDPSFTGFLPTHLELAFVERPKSETDSGVGHVRSPSEPFRTSATSSDLILAFPRRVTPEDVEQICASNRFRRHVYRSMLVSAFPGAYDVLLLDGLENAPRNLLVASSGRAGLERVVASTIVLDWELHTDLLVNVVRFIAEGKPATAFFDRSPGGDGDYRYILSTAKVSKLPHVVYAERLPDPGLALVGHHETLIFSPRWTESEVVRFRDELIASDLADHRRPLRRRCYLLRSAHGLLPQRMVQFTTNSAIDRECDEGIAAIKPFINNGFWENSFWTTYDVLMLLKQRGEDVSPFIDGTIDAIAPHLSYGSYDGVMGPTCALLDLRLASEAGIFGSSEKVRQFGKGWRETCDWIVSHFESQSPYDKMVAVLALAAAAEMAPSDLDDAKVTLRRMVDSIPDPTVGSELDIILFLQLSAVVGRSTEQFPLQLSQLLNLQSPQGKWSDARRTALVCDVLARVVRGAVVDPEQLGIVDRALFLAVTYLRSERLALVGEPSGVQANALALKALDSFNRATPMSTQDFLSDINRHNEEMGRSNALGASASFIDECLRQLSVGKDHLAIAHQRISKEEDARLGTESEIDLIKTARREDLKSMQRVRIWAAIFAAISFGLVISLVVLHRTVFVTMITEPFSIVAIMISGIVGIVLTYLTQPPTLTEPSRRLSLQPLVLGKRQRALPTSTPATNQGSAHD